MAQKIDIDELIRTSVKSGELPVPEKDFTDKVMSSLTAEPAASIYYRPLLSKKTLAGIGCGLAVVIALILLIPGFQPQSSPVFFDRIADRFKNISIGIDMPSSISYIVICTFLMLFVQALVISKFIRKVH